MLFLDNNLSHTNIVGYCKFSYDTLGSKNNNFGDYLFFGKKKWELDS